MLSLLVSWLLFAWIVARLPRETFGPVLGLMVFAYVTARLIRVVAPDPSSALNRRRR